MKIGMLTIVGKPEECDYKAPYTEIGKMPKKIGKVPIGGKQGNYSYKLPGLKYTNWQSANKYWQAANFGPSLVADLNDTRYRLLASA